MTKLKTAFLAIGIFFIFWIFLAGTSFQELLTGLIISIILTLLFYHKLELLADIKLNPRSIVFMFLYLFVFAGELIKANVDVARRVISTKLPINPGIVKVKTKLKTPLGRAILANSITLTPGTLTVELKDDFFYIHWIDVTNDNIEGATEAIVAKFEKYLEVIFG